jgi:hypothetical protein
MITKKPAAAKPTIYLVHPRCKHTYFDSINTIMMLESLNNEKIAPKPSIKRDVFAILKIALILQLTISVWFQASAFQAAG